MSNGRIHERLATVQTENPEDVSEFCPACSRRLEARNCKLICPSCGYYMSCSDFS